MKIALLGAGSFVFGPSMLNDTIVENRLDHIDIALMDPNAEAVEVMAGVGRRMTRDCGLNIRITTHTERAPAIDGADFVVCSAARQLQRRFATDCQIIDKHSPGHLVSEFGGIAGISYSLRQIGLIQEICADIRRHCPRAWLLDMANPLPRVAQAAHEEGVTTVGFCSASLYGYGLLWKILHGQTIDYPYDRAISEWRLTMGGMNHFSWVLDLREASTGRDLMPELVEKVRAGATAGQPMTERLLLDLGYFLMPGDAHIKDFLAPSGEASARGAAGHGNEQERAARMQSLRDVADGKTPLNAALLGRSWERPADLIAAMTTGKTFNFSSLNLINTGQMPGIPANVFVETPATASSGGPVAEKLTLPPAILSLCQRTATVTDAIVRAARRRSRKLLNVAVELDPTIINKAAGGAALAACLEAHSDVLPSYD